MMPVRSPGHAATRAHRLRRALQGLAVGAALVIGEPAVTPAEGQAVTQLYVTVDASRVIELREPSTKISLASPDIADVHVITPDLLLASGKMAGRTSLVVFSARSIQHFELVVHPAPLAGASLPGPGQAPHGVLVQRAGKVTEQLFTRDGSNRWIELGPEKPPTSPVKK